MLIIFIFTENPEFTNRCFRHRLGHVEAKSMSYAVDYRKNMFVLFRSIKLLSTPLQANKRLSPRGCS